MSARRHIPVILTRFLLAVSLLVILATTNLRVFLSLNYTDWQYRRLQESRDAGPDRSATADARMIIKYLQHHRETLPGLTEKEKGHLADVRSVFDLAFISTFAGIAALAAGITAIRKSPARDRLPGDIAWAALLGGGLLAVFLAAVLLDFASLFDGFHGIFFPSGTWLFDPNSALIRLFPFLFWVNAARDWALLTMAELALIGGGAVIWLRSASRRPR